ncbi:hypothetical protein [Cohnella cellulosilytica]|uniref:Lipoprotein n=1 Tax=Cohnella cellulosilytica TaxID=986710 RepID=A0ABW2F2E0_9BACL
MKSGLKPIAWLFVSILMMLGVTGCMFTSEKQMTKRMFDYLEEKYGGTYEKEIFEKGSTLFPDMYGGAKMMMHPVGQPDLPFYVFKGTSSEEFNDDYPLCYFSYHYTEKNKREIEELDDRDLIVKFALGFREVPQDSKILQTPVEEFVADENREGSIFLYVAVPVEGERAPEDDSVFFINLYKKMKELTDRNFIVSVAYVKQENYQDAVEAMRVAFAVNFSWNYIREGRLNDVYFRQSAPISDPSYFQNLLKNK